MENINSNIKEDIEVGVEYHTETIHLTANVNRDDDVPTDYTVDIDENTQNIVITPTNSKCFFTNEDTEDTIDIDITVNMLSDDDNFEYDVDVDEIGQIVISPKSLATQFISLVKEDNLNLITDADEPYEDSVSMEEIEYLTNNYTATDGTISTFYTKEKDCAFNLLLNKYNHVDCYQVPLENGTKWVIEYGEPKDSEQLTEDTEIIGNEDGDKWVVYYEFPTNESLTEADESQESVADEKATVLATNADEALKYAKQYAIAQRWNGAEVVAIRKQEV